MKTKSNQTTKPWRFTLRNLLFLMVVLTVGGIVVTHTACKKEETPAVVVPPGTSTTELLSLKLTTAPTMDGSIDAAWNACDKLTGVATVPDLANDFAFYTGESYNFTMRSMYDASNIYFLVEYADPKKSLDRQSWYFDATDKLWKQQNKKPKTTGDKFYEDKFAFLWPTATAGNDWNAATCYSTCHAVDKSKGYDTENKHYTNTASQVIDMWHYKGVRTGPSNQTDDQKMVFVADPYNPTATEKKDGGRSSDASTGGGVMDNVQTLNNGTADVKVPKFIIPGSTNYYWINATDTSGIAKRVKSVDANGILTYDGGTIDPSQGGYEAVTGTKRVPSIINNGALGGSRGDLITYASHTGSGWIFEIKRTLTTTDNINDIQYDIAKEYMFGFAIFENAAVGHGIMPNLKLKFAK